MTRNALYSSLAGSLYSVSERTAEFLGELLQPLSDRTMRRHGHGNLTCKYRKVSRSKDTTRNVV